MRAGMIDTQAIRQRWESVGSKLDERGRRVFAAGEVRATGWGGLEAVSEVTGLARSTIGRGLKDLNAAPLPKGRVRRKGGGRRHLSSRDTTLIKDLRNVIEPATLGDPMRPLLWVSKSYDKLASALQKKGHEISASSVKRLLPTLGYSRQSNRKADEGSKHPDRNAQFEHINAKAIAAQAARQPVISVDTKKKELIGNYKNGGTDYRPKGDPRRVKVHDFEDKELGKVVPYGVYDVGANAGWVSVGVTSDTAQFAVASIRRWLDAMGRERYPKARELTITADGGGSNGTRVRLWKVELQKLADETGLVLHVHHYPPGTSKWNKIEHRLFCHITQTWRGRPLVDRMAVVELIAATTTKAGLKVESALDTATYEKGIKVSDAEMKTLDIQGDAFHPEWNYTIRPRLIANRSGYFGEYPYANKVTALSLFC
jgi:Rhodopirellula transposase DDE domain